MRLQRPRRLYAYALAWAAALSCLCAVLLAAPSFASDIKVEYEDTLDEAKVTEATEVEIKAAFLLRFPDFVSWPESADDTLRIGVCRDDAMLGMLALLAEQENRQRVHASRVLRVVPVTSTTGARACSMLVLGKAVSTTLLPTVLPHDPAGLLTVGIWDEPRQGAIIRLFREEDHVRFEISQELAREAGVKISSKLLHLAKQQSERAGK